MNILIINGHPDKESLCNAMAQHYYNGAREVGVEVELLHLRDLNFKTNLEFGYRIETPLEPDLVNAQQLIEEASHIVLIYPVWWQTYPALLKGFIDRVFLPGFAFKYRQGSLFWDKYLKGKSARIIATMDTPNLISKLIYKKPGSNSLKKGILNFCGIKPVKVTTFSPVKMAKVEKINDWLNRVQTIGRQEASKLKK